MAIKKVTKNNFKATVSQSKVDVNIDLSEQLKGLNRTQKANLKKLVASTAIDEIRKSSLSRSASVNQKSSSNSFKKLSKSYRKKKMALGKGGQPNLVLQDEMLKSIFGQTKGDSVSLRITDKKNKAKAENHNHGVTLPKRQFLPTQDGQGFKREIMTNINRQIREFLNGIKKDEG